MAEANQLNGDQVLPAGQTLVVPARQSSAFQVTKAYDANQVLGDTHPNLPVPQPAPKKKKCVSLLIILVVVAFTVYVAGAASIQLGNASAMVGGSSTTLTLSTATTGNIFSAGLATLGGGGVVGGVTVASGWGTLGAAALGSAVGSAVGQGVAIAAGLQDKFNWKAVGLAALSGGVAAGVGWLSPGWLKGGEGLTRWLASAGRAAISNTVTQGLSVVLGLKPEFKCSEVVASALSAGIGAAVNAGAQRLIEPLKLGRMGEVMASTLGGIAGARAALAYRGGILDVRQIAVDVFGNALANSLVQSLPATAAAPQGPDSRWQQQLDDRLNEQLQDQRDFEDRLNDQAQTAMSEPGSGFGLKATPKNWAAFNEGLTHTINANQQARQGTAPEGNPVLSQAIHGPGITDSSSEAELLNYQYQLSGLGGEYALRATAGDRISLRGLPQDVQTAQRKALEETRNNTAKLERQNRQLQNALHQWALLDSDAYSAIEDRRRANLYPVQRSDEIRALPERGFMTSLTAELIGSPIAFVRQAWGDLPLNPITNELENFNGADRKLLAIMGLLPLPAAKAETASITAVKGMTELQAKWGFLSSSERWVLLQNKAEANAARRLMEMQATTPGAHYFEKHGAQLSLQSQFDRAAYGLNPTTGASGYATTATRFFNHRDQLNTIMRAELIYSQAPSLYQGLTRLELAQSPTVFKYVVGSGFQKNTLNYGIQYSGRAFINPISGRAITAFPVWGQ